MRALPYSNWLLGLCLCASPISAFELNTLEWPPYTSEALPAQGQVPSLLRGALAQQNIPLKIRFLPWNRAIKTAISEPETLGYFPEYRAPDLPCEYSDSLGTSRLGLAHRSSEPLNWQQLSDLARYRIGVVSGYRNTPAFDQAVADGALQVEEATSDQLNLLKLLYGRLDLVVIDQAVMQYWLDTSEELSSSAEQLAFAPRLLGELTLHVCFVAGPDAEQARRQLNQALREFRR
ncbi:substrate-binding periplasmic protein [Halopseudomonas maritima]|uniref:substrate-binding periplasmic protein n=1 Tax=Halopseudomonas maritima TaxID=2918528 RepID=UPI001EEB9557|nr:ABC transporter substrate-binding protein [Halopseudomonas maritima]UJJ30209.1 ABC transporter substrate-binding protein [Halopseudomonas maritima]